jgi:hypothetical protein
MPVKLVCSYLARALPTETAISIEEIGESLKVETLICIRQPPILFLYHSRHINFVTSIPHQHEVIFCFSDSSGIYCCQQRVRTNINILRYDLLAASRWPICLLQLYDGVKQQSYSQPRHHPKRDNDSRIVCDVLFEPRLSRHGRRVR